MRLRSVAGLVLALMPAGCILHAREIEPVEIASPPPHAVVTPVRAHLADGSVIVFRAGVRSEAGRLIGGGTRYDVARRETGGVEGIGLDSVVALETFTEGENEAATLAASIPLSIVGGTAAAGGAIIIFKAIFGSCPTVYSDSGGATELEAEGYSYSIARLFEMRDVDRLRVTASDAGEVRLEVRNEALETHYTDHFGLLEVRHAADETVAPDARGEPVAVRRVVAPASARDRGGRDVLAVIAAADGDATRVPEAELLTAGDYDIDDVLELAIAAPEADSVALVLRLRNSLLNTVLLYEFMLENAGLGALDWLGRELSDPFAAFALGRWYVEHMGLRIQVRDGVAWREVARLGDSGPIAWKDVHLPIPVLEADSLRVRVVYLADAWRVDRAAFALESRRMSSRPLEVVRVIGADGRPDAEAAAAVRTADSRYLATTPGDRYWMHFDAGPIGSGAASPAEARTFMLDARGYYTEWIRPEWVTSERVSGRSFRPRDEVLVPLVRRWGAVRDDFERRFFETRLPVR